MGLILAVAPALAKDPPPPTKAKAGPTWKKGKGWGWIWGRADERGALNAITDASRLAALALVREGRAFDLGVPYDRESFRAGVHNPGEIISFRTPEGLNRQRDVAPLGEQAGNKQGTAFHSNALFINDNIGTQIDGLGHITTGADNHWYNGFREADWGGDFGLRKTSADGIPPIVAWGVLIDVAGAKGVDMLPPHTAIGVGDLQAALEKQGTSLAVGDVVLIRTGMLRLWGMNGRDVDGRIAAHDTAGITKEAARWLVEENGAIMIGADTSSLEWFPPADQQAAHNRRYGTFVPVHVYLLIEQGVHVGEFHYLEALARDRIYEFAYICATNRIRGATAGFALRPIALR